MSDLPIFIAGRFAVHKLFHARGMGDVYIGRDTQNGRRVAVKVFAPRWLRFPGTWGEVQYFHAPAPPIGTVPFGTSPQGPAYHAMWVNPLGTLAGWPQG